MTVPGRGTPTRTIQGAAARFLRDRSLSFAALAGSHGLTPPAVRPGASAASDSFGLSSAWLLPAALPWWAASALLAFVGLGLAALAIAVFGFVARRKVAALRREREALSLALAQVDDGVILFDEGGRVTFMNEAAERLTAWSLQEAKGRPWETVLQLVGEKTRTPSVGYVEKASGGSDSVSLLDSALLVGRDGLERPVECAVSPLSARRAPYLRSLVVRDVAQRRAEEVAAEEAKRLYSELFEHAPDLMCVVETSTSRIVECNETLCDALGFRKAEVVGLSLSRLHPSESRAKIEAAFRDVAAGRKVQDARLKLVRKDRRKIVASLTASGERDERGRVVRVRCVFRDVTRRTFALKFVAEATQRLNIVLSATGIGLWMNELPLSRLNWDGRTRELFFVPPGTEPTIELFWERLHPEDREATRAVVEAAIRDAGSFEIDHRVVDPRTGEIRWLRTAGKATCDSKGRPTRFDGLNFDITARKRQDEELQELTAKLSEADRRKDEFLAMLAHELRNPLAPIRTGLDLLALDAGENESIVRVMQEQVEHLVRLVDDLLDVSRIMRGKVELRRERTELAGIVKRSVDAVRPALDAQGQRLTVSLPPEPIWLDADPIRMVQVVANLLNNASKYSDRDTAIALAVRQEGGEASIEVRDEGIGIEPDLLPRIFDLFTQSSRSLDRSQGGLGIGLTLVQRLVAMHGGSVEAHSEGPGRGSAFVVRLPAATAPAPAETANVGRDAPQGRRVLAVDDNVAVGRLLAKLLGKLGHTDVTIVHDGASALRAFEEVRPEVVLLDIGLPGMDGFEVARRLRAQAGGDEALLVALTGHGREEDRRLTEAAGFDVHLVKPPTKEQIVKAMSHRRHAPQDP